MLGTNVQRMELTGLAATELLDSLTLSTRNTEARKWAAHLKWVSKGELPVLGLAQPLLAPGSSAENWFPAGMKLAPQRPVFIPNFWLLHPRVLLCDLSSPPVYDIKESAINYLC